MKSETGAQRELRDKIIQLTREFASQMKPGSQKFVPGESAVPYAARVFDEDEVCAAVDSVLDFWLTLGPHGQKMESGLGSYLGVRTSLLMNSGSSANLVAMSALTSPALPDDRRIKVGDEVITCATGFPTTVAPIIQNGAVAVFVDSDPITGNIRADLLNEALNPGKTKAVMIAHTLGIPFDLGTIATFCRENNLWLIEDNCDALGSSYTIPADHPLCASLGFAADEQTDVTRLTGAWGDLSTQSFYPPHHMTMGEGGAVSIVRNVRLKRLVESFRDWGRDCWCPSGVDNTCGKRFDWELGQLPKGYDHKYIYSHLGYNLKPLDPQAAIGVCQLEKLPRFVQARMDNWDFLRTELNEFSEFFEFNLPTHATAWTPNGFEWDDSGCRSTCSWFGFMLFVKQNSPFSRSDLARHLDGAKIGNRMLFGGNLLRQPALISTMQDRPEQVRKVGSFEGADRIMNDAIFIGTYPGLTKDMLGYIVDVIREFVSKH